MTSIVYIRNDSNEFVCPFDSCSFVTDRQNTMHYHQKNHAGDKPHVCSVCPKKFVQKSGLDQHMAQVHRDVTHPGNIYADVSWSCPCCDHSAKMKPNMRVHIMRKHCSASVPPMADDKSCISCSKIFKSPTAYYYHAATCFELSPEMKESVRPFL
jgi:hypothetical protein